MAEEQKTVEVPKDTVPAITTEQPAAETKPVETTEIPAAAPVPATTQTPATTTTTETPVEAATEAAAAPAEDVKKEVTPVEEGHLEHKGINFPKNFIYSKEFFWFGSDALESKNLSSYLKSEKSTETAHHNAAWASHTGKGLLFFGDRAAPQGVINLADASEPAADGANKFHFTAKAHKHTFKAGNAEERDNWISQLKLKIAEAKELATSVTETEAYKSALESFKPAKKEEKVAEAPAVEAPAATETPVVETPAAVATETAAAETPKEEEAKKEEPKRRSASRKRGSIFGNLLGKKDEKKEEKKEEAAVPAVAETPKEEIPAAPAAPTVETPVVEAPVAETTAAPAVETPAAAVTETAAEDKPAEAAETPKEEKKEKPLPTKRNSIFGVFGKKEKKAAAAAEAEAAPAPVQESEIPPAAETAPVIPPVEATTPLAVDVANPSTVPVEIKETAPATNTEPRPDLKEKRKSSLPFGFGKRDKSPAKSPAHSDNEEAEKQEKTSTFSKLRATIKGRGKPSAEKPADKLEKTEEKPETPVDATKVAEETPAAETSKATEEPENKPENVATSTPAPVTAAA